MDAFEEIIVGLFKHQRKPYWTWQGYKINLTKDEKKAIGKPSMPRPEIDVLAYRPNNNELLWIECKSYLDSFGVTMDSFDIEDGSPSRFKVFTNTLYREIASARLLQQLSEDGLILPNPSLNYCLVAGKVYPKSREQVKKHFQEHNWLFYDESWIRERLGELADLGYENDVAIIVAKLFERTKVRQNAD
jgi:hypothetical protein